MKPAAISDAFALIQRVRRKLGQKDIPAQPAVAMPGSVARPFLGSEKPLFIHFGARKTGSSSIQETLLAHAGAKHGFAYPDLGMANGSLAVSLAFLKTEHLLSRRLVRGTLEAATRRQLQLVRLGKRLAQGDASLPRVISAESIAHFDPDELADLDRFLLKHTAQRTYIGYIREPVSYKRSVFQETLKLQNPVGHRFDADAPTKLLADRTWRVVEHLDALVGRPRVRAFAFDRDSFPGGDVVRHFLREIGAQDEGMQIARVNESLSLLGVKLLYLYRSRIAAHDRDLGSSTTHEAFIADLSDLGGQAFEWHGDVVQRIVDANREVYEWSVGRLDRPLIAPTGRPETGIRSFQDLESLDPQEEALFVEYARTRGLNPPARLDADAIAAMVQQLRLGFAQGQYGGDPSSNPVRTGLPRPAAVTLGSKAKVQKPRLYLHIGMGKTGTTSIQRFCWRNRTALAKAGITYPDRGIVDGAHHRLSPDVPAYVGRNWNSIDPGEWSAQLLNAYDHPILLSSELMASAEPDTVRRLAEVLLPLFDVRVIVYVRRIDDSIMATYNQNVKAGTQRLSLEDVLPRIFERLRIDRVLAPWLESFGLERLMIRAYDRRQFAGGDILHDFCETIGVPWSDEFRLETENPNARLGRSALEFKRCLNNVIPNTEISNRFNAALMAYSAQKDETARAIFHDADLLPGAVRRLLIARQEEFYRDLARARSPDGGGSLFNMDLPGEDLDWKPMALSDEAFAEIARAVLTPDLAKLLRAQAEEAQTDGNPQRLLYAGRFLPFCGS